MAPTNEDLIEYVEDLRRNTPGGYTERDLEMLEALKERLRAQPPAPGRTQEREDGKG